MRSALPPRALGPLFVAGCLAGALSAQNLVLNGSFEDTTTPECAFNLDNDTVELMLPDVVGIGDAHELDLDRVTACDWGLGPQHGEWKVGLHCKSGASLEVDAVALKLAAGIAAGTALEIRLAVAGKLGSPAGAVEVGLSSTATSFGTPVAQAKSEGPDAWTSYSFVVLAPHDVTHLSLRQAKVNNSYSFVDEVEVELAPCGGLAALATETVRLGDPPNPDVFRPGRSGGPIVGSSWDPWIEHTTFQPTAILDFVALGSQATNLPTASGTVLCGSAPYLVVGGPAGALPPVPIPDQCSLIGAAVYSQGGSIDAANVVLLANGLDLILGTH